MSIADKLQRIIDTKDDIRDAIEAKGRDLTNKTFEDDYAAEIAAIETGGGVEIEVAGQQVITGEFEESIVAGDTVSAYYDSGFDGVYTGTVPNITGFIFTSAASNEHLVYGISSSPFLYIWRRSAASTLVDDVTIDIMPSNFILSSAFSPSKTYLALSGRGPAVTIYKIENNTFTKLVSPTITLSGSLDGTQIAFSKDEQFLYVKCQQDTADNFLVIFQRTGDTFQQVFSNNTANSSQVITVPIAVSADDKYIAVPNGKGFRLYKRNLINNTFQSVATAGGLTGDITSLFITSDYKIFMTTDSPFIYHKQFPFELPFEPRNNSFQINQDDTLTIIDSIVKGDWVDFREARLIDSEEYMVGLFPRAYSADWLARLIVYKKVNGNYYPTKGFVYPGQGVQSIFFSAFMRALSVSPDGQMIAVGYNEGRRWDVFKNNLSNIELKIHKINNRITDQSLFAAFSSPSVPVYPPQGAAINSTVSFALGYALEDGNEGEQKTMMSLFRQQ